MTLDPYQLCPCGSGKKVKFCCSRDIVHELERIQRMVEGEQRLAALEKIDSLLGKYPDRSSLLMLKAEVELALDQADKAGQTVQRLLEIDPQNPSVQALPAIMTCLERESIHRAVEQLQRSFEVADSVVTPRMYEALLLVSLGLMREGFPAAAKGHLQLALEVTRTKDQRCVSLFLQLNQTGTIPLLLRESLDFAECPDDVTWKIEFQTAMAEAYRGRWLLAADKLSDMSKRILDAAPILKNLGVLRSWLAQNKEAVVAFRALSRIREMPLEERVDAEALAQLLDLDSDATQVEIVKEIYHVPETDRLMEQCLSRKQLRQLEVQPTDSEDDQPPPKALFDLLDRPWPEANAEWKATDVPRSIGTMAIYGRQTDREARIELITARVQEPPPHQQLLQELLGEAFREPVSTEVLTKASRLMTELFSSWRVPPGLEPQRRAELIRDLHRHAVLERWPSLPSPLLGDKTPREAAQAGRSRVPLMATLLILELMVRDGSSQVDMGPLREELNLPAPGPIEAAEADVDRLPVHHFLRLNVSELSDDQLVTAYRRAYGHRDVASLRGLAQEVIHRPSLDEKIDKVEAYDILSDIAPSTDEALEYLEKARKLATSEGESPAQWLIDELELRLLRGELEQFLQLLKEIQSRYMKEPGVSSALMEVLSRYGLVTPDGRLMIPTKRDVAAAAATHEVQTAPAVWTPDAPPPTPPPSEADEKKEESKLWLPGMD